MKRLFSIIIVVAAVLVAPAQAQATYSSTKSGEWATIIDNRMGISYQCAQIHDQNWMYMREWKCILNGVEYWATCTETEYDAGDGGMSTRIECTVSGTWSQTPAIGVAAANQGAASLRESLTYGGYYHLPGWGNTQTAYVENTPNGHC